MRRFRETSRDYQEMRKYLKDLSKFASILYGSDVDDVLDHIEDLASVLYQLLQKIVEKCEALEKRIER